MWNSNFREAGGWRRWHGRLQPMKAWRIIFLNHIVVLIIPCTRLWSPWIWLLLLVSIDPTRDIFPRFIFLFNFNLWSGVKTKEVHIKHNVCDPLDLITHTFWLWSNGPYFLGFYFIFWFLYFKCFKLQKII